MIDEKRLIEEMKRTFPDKLLNDKHWFWGEASFMDLFKELVEEQPKVGEWIPCSERLPKETEGEFYPSMYITTKCGDVKLGFYRLDDEKWYILGDEVDDEPEMAEDDYVIAWQDVPKPYSK